MTDKVGPSQAAKRVTDRARRDLTSSNHLAVVVDSPPGAGKSTFVVDTAARLARIYDQVPLIAQTNAQADDLIRTLTRTHPRLPVGRLTGSSGGSTLDARQGLTIASKIADHADCKVVVGTASKWSYVSGKVDPFPVGIIDEAYQMRSDQLLYVAPVMGRALLVGDPGQLDPFTPVDESRWRGQADGPVNPAVATVLHNHPGTPVHKLPVSWRLSARCAPLVSSAFYPTMPFRSGTRDTDRALIPAKADRSAIGRAVDQACETGWGFLELPARIAPPTDRDAVSAVARAAIAFLARGVTVYDSVRNPTASMLEPARLAVGVVHRAQRSAVSLEIRRQAAAVGIEADAVTVDTANRLQGREFDVTVVLHPLSGRAAASEFHLETGRLCVLLSRHRHACLVVGRAGISDVLDVHPEDMPVWLGAPIPVPDGWEANQSVLEQLSAHTVRLRGTA